MKTGYLQRLLLCLMLCASLQFARAQNTSPYWSLAGNSNATSSAKLGTTNSTALRFLTNNTERMRIDASGKIGIGTSFLPGLFNVKLGGSTPATSWISGGT